MSLYRPCLLRRARAIALMRALSALCASDLSRALRISIEVFRLVIHDRTIAVLSLIIANLHY